MTSERIDKAIEIINYAIKTNISLSEGSIKFGYASKYASNVKDDLFKEYENGIVDDEIFTKFSSLYNEYVSNNTNLFKFKEKDINIKINKIIEIINYAINNNISLSEASVKSGYASTYVSNNKTIILEKHENGTLDSESFSLFNEAYKNYEKNRGVESNKKEILIPNKETNVLPNVQGEKSTFKQNGGNAEYEWVGGSSYPKDHIRTVDQLLAAGNVDLDVWKVKDYVINKWDTTSTSRNGEANTRQNFQVKARLERIEELFKCKNAAEIFVDMVKNYKPTILDIEPANFNHEENNLLEITVADLHLGKLCWAGETGENYDLKIASKRFLDAIKTLLKRASGFQYNRILFPVGNDFFNSDNIENCTSHGTPQSEDERWQKTFQIGTKLLVDGINLLKQTGVNVEVLVVSGNHDFSRSYYIGSFLEAWFNNDPMVNINNGASPRKYYRFGKVLLGFTHGSEEKESSLPLLMASDIESKPFWSETTYHEWHLGHIHRKRNIKYDIIDTKSKLLNEDLGVTVRYLSSLSGTDNWHHTKGFIGQIKAADAFIWNFDNGLVAHLNSNLVIE